MGQARIVATTAAPSETPLALLRTPDTSSGSAVGALVTVGLHGGILLVIALLAHRVTTLPERRTEAITVNLRDLLGGRGAPPPLKGEAAVMRPAAPPEAPPRPVPRPDAPVRDAAPHPAPAVPEGIAGVPEGARDGDPDGRLGSWGNGSGGDAVGGPGTGTGPGSGDGPVPGFGVPGTPVRVAQAELLHRVEPRYPRIGRVTGREGTVVLDAVIDEEGRVVDAVALSGDPIFVEASIEAVRQWRFRPATRDGRPMRMVLTVSVTFNIHR